MEESEKRRERLKAMRMEANQADASTNIDTSTAPVQLSNPFVESSASMLVQERSPAPARFDFYTDPMAAFSSNKRKINQNFRNSPSPVSRPPSSHLAGPRNFDMTSPSRQYHIGHSADQRMYEAPSANQGSGSWRSPAGMATPSSGHWGTPPGIWNKSVGTASYGFSPNSSGSGFGSPAFGQGGSYSFSPNSGRGSGGRFSNSSSPRWGRGGGRGRGTHALISAREKPELFYRKSMIEDPWGSLIPVVKSLSVSAESSWLPKSISMKRDRGPESAIMPNSQHSLAECLAAAFEEATDDTTDT